MNDEREPPDTGDDADLAALLRAAGPRLAPPPDVAAEVRAGVAAEWRAAVAARRPRRRTSPWLAAASVAALAVGAWLLAPPWMPAPASVATVARTAGPVEYRSSTEDVWQPLAVATRLQRGDQVRTSAAGRVALRREDGLEVRLDAATALTLEAADTTRLETGRLYVDAGRADSRAGAFAVATPFGNVRHLGTQYSVGLANDALAVAVREGSVAVEGDAPPVVARAGERLTVQRDGRVARSAVEPHGDEWRWAQSVAPEFAIDGRTLDEFLVWAARETGRQLVYTSAEAAREAEQTVLKGAVAGLPPEDAVAAVLTTTPSLEHGFAGSQLRIGRASPP
ncbi:MAG TPA: FecR family protein [Steroidobacteraceae bacterium]|nr:FecR family protein [Steroidobacteraceae bacterium]